MDKITAIITAGLFSAQVHAATPLVQFDTKNNQWPSTFGVINGMGEISSLTTIGKYTIAFSDNSSPNLLAFNNGVTWSKPLVVPNFSANTLSWVQVIPQYPDTKTSPASWVYARNSDQTINITYFDGNKVLDGTTLPFTLSDPTKHFLFEARHSLCAVDYKENRVYWSSNTKWFEGAKLPKGEVISVTTDSSNDNVYALELDLNQNKYFITYLDSHNGWAPPVYLNFSNPSDMKLSDYMVFNNGNTMVWMLSSISNDNHVLISKDGGKNIKDTGSIPHTFYKFGQHFDYIYNGNKRHTLCSMLSLNVQWPFFDTIAYFDPSANDPGWVQVTLPQPLKLYTGYEIWYPYYWNPTGEDGSQIWAQGELSDGMDEVYYYDLKSRSFTDTNFGNPGGIYLLQAADHGKAFAYGIGGEGVNSYVMGFYYDGHTWKNTRWTDKPASIPPAMFSYGYRNEWRLHANNYASWFKPIVDESSQNVWIFLGQIMSSQQKSHGMKK